jgi:two-component system, cell cycle sensor histidine kinase and response regulator CckA
MLRNPQDEHLMRERATDILYSAEQATGLAGQLVSFSRRYSACPSTVDLNRVLKDGEGLFQQIAAGKTRLAIIPDEKGPVPVHIDRAHAEFIALRLLLYGLDTFQAGASTELRAGSTELDVDPRGPGLSDGRPRPGVFATVTVIGHGWEPLRAERYGAITRRVLDQIILEYDGFSPIETLEDDRTGLSVCMPGVEIAVGVRDSRETILLVDDDPMVLELSRELLEMDGYRVLTAGDAADAEAIADQGTQFDLLLTDVVMPNITGPMLAQRLRQRRPGLKVLFVSGYATNQERVGTSRTQDMMLAKPFSADELAVKIREVLDRPESNEMREVKVSAQNLDGF